MQELQRRAFLSIGHRPYFLYFEHSPTLLPSLNSFCPYFFERTDLNKKYIGSIILQQQITQQNDLFKMSLRKNQLKKMTIDEIMTHLSSQTDADNIKLISGFIGEKNSNLIDKKNGILAEISQNRRKIEKSIRNLNGRIKDRIDKKQTIVLDKDSRPNKQSVTELMALFSYHQSQGAIINRNNASIKEVAHNVAKIEEELKVKLTKRMNFDELDRQFEYLNAQCKKEQAIRDELLKQRNEKRAHYANIQNSIQKYRREYQKVQSQIQDKQRQLLRLSGYYDARVNEDKQMLQQLPVCSLQYENELLATQSQLNACFDLLNDRKMLQIEQWNVTTQ